MRNAGEFCKVVSCKFFATENFDKLDFSPTKLDSPRIGVRQGGGVPGDEVERLRLSVARD